MKLTTAVNQVLKPVLAGGYCRATKYITPRFTVKATHQHKSRKNARSITLLLTLGQPNYAEREFIKKARKAGLSYPIRKVQVKAYALRKDLGGY